MNLDKFFVQPRQTCINQLIVHLERSAWGKGAYSCAERLLLEPGQHKSEQERANCTTNYGPTTGPRKSPISR